MSTFVKDKWFWLIAALALALRLWQLWHAQQSPTFLAPAVDPLWYHQAAERVANNVYGPWPLFRAPLYPILLGWLYKFVLNDLLWARILNIVFQMSTLVVIYAVAERFFSRASARVAALLFAVNGMVIYFSAEILSTSLEMLLAVLAAWSTLALRRSPTSRMTVICGLIWGLAAITRPNFLLVAPVALLVALWPLNRRASLSQAALAMAALLLPILPVTIANLAKGGELVLIATQGGVNFWIGNHPNANGVTSQLPGSDRFWTMEQAAAMAEAEAGRTLAGGELSDFYYAKGRDFLLSKPLAGLRLMVRKASLFFNRFEVSNNKHIAYFSAQTPGLSFLILLNFALLLPLGVLGLWSVAKGEAKLLWWLTLAYAGTVILFFIASRFRMPVVPWLCLLAGAGVAAWQALPKRARLTAGIIAAVTLLLALSNPYDAREAPVESARYMEGNAYLELNQLDSARACFAAARNDKDTRPRALLNLGVVEQRAGRLPQARQAYAQLLSETPDHVAGWNNLGVVEEARKDTIAALNAYAKALSLDESFTDARENLARLLIEQGKFHLRWLNPWSAREPLEQSVAVLPSASGYYHLALAYGQSNDYERAEAALDDALKLNPQYDLAAQLKRQIELARSGLPVPWPVTR